MNITKVRSNDDKKAFLKLACSIYKKENNWIRPLDKDINAVFDKKINKTFRKGEVERWILMDEGNIIGRIAAFYS